MHADAKMWSQSYTKYKNYFTEFRERFRGLNPGLLKVMCCDRPVNSDLYPPWVEVFFPWHQIQLFCPDPRHLILPEIVSFNICMRIPGLHYVTPPLSTRGHWNICSIWWRIQSYVHKHLSWDESCSYFHSVTYFKQTIMVSIHASKTWMNVILEKLTIVLSTTEKETTLYCGNETLKV